MSTPPQNDVTIHLLSGADLTEAGSLRVDTVSSRVALGGTAGLRPERKVDSNEDIVAYLESGDREAVVIADGHFGRRAAEIAVEGCIAQLERAHLEFGDPESALSLMISGAEERIAEELAPSFQRLDESPETSLLVFLRQADKIAVAGAGDSLVFHVSTAGRVELLAPLQQSWLGVGSALRSRCPDLRGARKAAREMGVDWWYRGKAEKAAAIRQPISKHFHHTYSLADGDAFLIATDGLIEGREDTEQQVGYALMKTEGRDAAIIAEEFLQGTLARGAPDNVAFALLLP